jgi:hypothetical protein
LAAWDLYAHFSYKSKNKLQMMVEKERKKNFEPLQIFSIKMTCGIVRHEKKGIAREMNLTRINMPLGIFAILNKQQKSEKQFSSYYASYYLMSFIFSLKHKHCENFLKRKIQFSPMQQNK